MKKKVLGVIFKNELESAVLYEKGTDEKQKIRIVLFQKQPTTTVAKFHNKLINTADRLQRQGRNVIELIEMKVAVFGLGNREKHVGILIFNSAPHKTLEQGLLIHSFFLDNRKSTISQLYENSKDENIVSFLLDNERFTIVSKKSPDCFPR